MHFLDEDRFHIAGRYNNAAGLRCNDWLQHCPVRVFTFLKGALHHRYAENDEISESEAR
jgi:hypothetical protein